ncbi:MAG: BamA/TamA family outer membrane protein [Brachymonas sp.]|nr:BamA/TamA family outer membrane protein [Brachymonas sp.]
MVLMAGLVQGTWAQPVAPASAPQPPASTASAAVPLQEPLPPDAAPPDAAEPEDDKAGNANSLQDSFTIRIEAPAEVRSLVDRFLELKRYQRVPDLDDVELRRLLELSEQQIRRLLATEGYFTPQIEQQLVLPDAAATFAPQRPEVVITIDPGTQARVDAFDLHIDGAAATYEPAWQQVAQARANWGLPVGEVFTQKAWGLSKAQFLQHLQTERFATAKLADSKAEIDPDQHAAHLHLRYDSGPVYRYGAVQVQGAQRYDETIVHRLAQLQPGAEYRQSELIQMQQRLLNSGYYAGASVVIDTSAAANPEAAPVLASVQELPLQKVVFGVGFNTDRGAGASLEHTHNRVPGLKWRALTRAKLYRDQQQFSTSLIAPPSASLWQSLFSLSYNRETIGDYRQTTAQARAGRTKNSGEIERTWYLQYDRSREDYAHEKLGDAQALSLNYIWSRRHFNSLVFPTSGYGLTLEGGGGMTLGKNRAPFVRVGARYLGILSLDRSLAQGLKQAVPRTGDPASPASASQTGAAAANVAQSLLQRRNGELLLRLEGAALRTRANAVVPPNLLFLAGGNASVRGYGYQQIGVEDADGITRPGHYMVTGSLEYRRPVWRNGRPTDWDSVVFVDAGSVAHTPAGLRHLKVGVGAGALWRSPAGPIQLAVAYGLQDRKVRLHMNLGFSF